MINKFLSYLAFNVAKLISLLPFSWLYTISSIFSFITFNIFNYRRDVIIQNLSRSFPGLKYNEIKEIAESFFLHFTDTFIEVIKTITISEKEFKKRVIVTNPELVNSLHEEGRTIIGLTGHIGNWELLSIVPGVLSFPCYTLYKPLSSKITENIMFKIRKRFGMRLLPMSNAARYILSSKNVNAFYIFIGDQSPVRNDSAPKFNFLNQETTFFSGGAKLATAIDAAVVYISIKKLSRGHYTISFIPLSKTNDKMLPLINDKGRPSDKLEKEIEILNTYSKLLESDIIENPQCWLWSHKRWKH